MCGIAERCFVAVMLWLVVAGFGAVAVGIIHLLVSFAFWEMIPIKEAIPMLRLMAGAALIPAILGSAFHKPNERN